MALLLFTVFLWAATIAMGVLAYRKNDGTFSAGIQGCRPRKPAYRTEDLHRHFRIRFHC